MTSNKGTYQDDIHITILKRAKKRYMSHLKVFDKNSLEFDEKSILEDARTLGLSPDDIQELIYAKPTIRPTVRSAGPGRKGKKRLRVMLMGPGSKTRQYTATGLEGFSYEPIIMEDYSTNPASKGGLDDLFVEICNNEDPYLFVAFMYPGADLRAIEDEISFLRAQQGTFFSNKLIILYGPDFDFSELSSYIREMIQKVPYYQFDNSIDYKAAHTIIHRHVLNMRMKKKWGKIL